MFLVVNLTEINVFALKEETCMSTIKSLANVRRLRPCHTEMAHGGSRWGWCAQHLLDLAHGPC